MEESTHGDNFLKVISKDRYNNQINIFQIKRTDSERFNKFIRS